MASRSLKQRLNMLLEIERLLKIMKTEIAFSSRTIAEIVSGSKTDFALFAQGTPGFDDNPARELEKAAQLLIKNRDDRELFAEFLLRLGTGDAAGQLEHIELYEKLFSANAAAAAKACDKKSRIYLCMGVFSGIGLSALIV